MTPAVPAPTPPPSPTTPSATVTPLRPTATATATVTVQPTPSATPQGPPPLALRQWPAMQPKEWPRPERDNGLGIHFLPQQYYSDKELDYGISRMNEMGLRWALVLYGDENHLERAARKFKQAGIMVVWRKALRSYESYYGWERDIKLLQSLGVAPYMQVYNEPELAEEWDGRPISPTLYMDTFLQASRDIYNAGGFVGLQFIQPEWLVNALQALKARRGEAIFGRMFFIPHPYGLNHPPEYQEDPNGVLGFLRFADIFRQEIGFVPPMIAGEGGWKYKAQDDKRFPVVDDRLHREYHVAVFDWFRSGNLSNGQPLPDYLLAFCPWLLFGGDAAVWVDGFEGTRTLTIDAVKSMSAFVRRFSWEQ